MTQPLIPIDQCPIQIEDDRTGTNVETLKRAFADNLFYLQGKYESLATQDDFYMALAYTLRDRLLSRWLKTTKTYMEKDVKVVYYLSAEFLMGRHMGNSLINLHLYDRVRQAVEESGLDLDEILEHEPDPGLGNGGLGRLAACFVDSLATLEIPAVGYGIRYEFGIFTQAIRDGWQAEVPDKWLRFGNPWEIAHPDQAVEVKLGGHTEMYHNEKGEYKVRWIPANRVVGIPYDTPVPGYDTNTVNPLRLWRAEASDDFNFDAFNAGNYDGAVAEKMRSETISKVLYPNDNTPQGKQLRLEQQFFFVSCSLQDIIRTHLLRHPSLHNLHDTAAIQLNDTHPAVAIAEMMRLLMDEHEMDWNTAWRVTQKTFSYTNHTLLPEALEKWSVGLFEYLLPRHLEIIYEINRRFLEDVKRWYPGDDNLISRLSLIDESGEKYVRMANLACVGSHAVNGVAALHTQLLKQDTLRDFYRLWPGKFINKTNGVTPRRWILMCNPKLAELYNSKIGEGWLKDLSQLKQLEKYVDDPDFCQQWREIKLHNKRQLAQYIWEHNGIEVDPHSMFDIQVKRIHEYKRQHLNLLHIIALYNQIKQNPDQHIVPCTFIFGGKAAPGYFMAKLIIKLTNSVADVINHDPDVRGRLKIVFLNNFNVSLGQRIYPAADLSEQVSTAGKEASGTGNMKFAMNGAMTIGTLDGANIEIREEAGEENFFLFGLTAQEVADTKAKGYNPRDYYSSNPSLKAVIDRIAAGYFSHGDKELFKPLVDSLMYHDQYMLFADYQAYVDCHKQVSKTYSDQDKWTRMSILNALRMAKFSSDRTIREYCNEIWNVQPVPIEMEEYSQENAGLNLGK
ncbi:MAG: glycogen/starch/alpha-glucan phosphorylase [Limnospira sp. PMC 894.15]|uniref:Alpha-1,4 glucan phosphorylase n=1 Tax=Limnospira fusiformis PMC 851.14 TaxID=2219512 RepID=A0ABU9ELC9_LIMFS|nr:MULTISPECIES: glycogen/starch/alpha-glucan phosphorylase [unclassified Limnospira]MDT9186336.1 glycogen/starch/alpha-glucan phosphorylase [Limnospira sp. PMC 894.15]MDT9232390.1 glycogen/starch/alpha-glucan phosphorylase [Limnospira sp. PMC 917.15]MDT9273115.1 glycogen/starch/alpha-glucan phosphorylase [Limnospira sp. PMC 737.11]